LRSSVPASIQMTALVLLACLMGGCAREQGAQGDVDADGAQAPPSTPSVVVGEDRPLPGWRAPSVEVEEDSREALLDEAAAALEEGRLFGGDRDAIPLYLALRTQDPEDRRAAEGLESALAALLAQGGATLDADDSDPERMQRAREIAAVARTVGPGRDDVLAYLERVDRNDEVHALNEAGERELAAGRVGEDDAAAGAIAHFRAALERDPDSVRAARGLDDAEAALVARAVEAARAAEFDEAARWLDAAAAVKAEDSSPAILAGRVRVAAERGAHVRRLRDQGIAAVMRPDGLAQARRHLDELLQLAEPGDPAATELRERIDLATHYGLYRPGQAFTDGMRSGGRGPVMVVVPHGGFGMGAGPRERDASDAERPQHYVRFDRGFALARTEATVGQFRRFVEATGHQTRAERRGYSTVYDERRGNLVRRSGVDWRHDYTGAPAADDLPVLHVSARDAEAYAQWLSEQTGQAYRLPSEAEFEYALRAGSEGRFPWGDTQRPPPGAGNFTGARDRSPGGRDWRNAFPDYDDGYWGPAPVASFAANAFGLHDVAGNVSEWVADCWHDSYRRAPADGGAWVNPGCRTRVLRGGSWASSPAQTRSAWRLSADADTTNARLGFRVARGI
jgi:formylglycine-generating enzyme required for sulfatase activity